MPMENYMIQAPMHINQTVTHFQLNFTNNKQNIKDLVVIK